MTIGNGARVSIPAKLAAARPAPTSGELVSRIAGGLEEQPATLSTLDGRYITGGLAEFAGNAGAWRATLRHLERPGVVASMYFAEGLRDVVVRLADGRVAKARITATSFIAQAQRVCELTGSERFS
jgi:hypothetical protein